MTGCCMLVRKMFAVPQLLAFHTLQGSSWCRNNLSAQRTSRDEYMTSNTTSLASTTSRGDETLTDFRVRVKGQDYSQK